MSNFSSLAHELGQQTQPESDFSLPSRPSEGSVWSDALRLVLALGMGLMVGLAFQTWHSAGSWSQAGARMAAWWGGEHVADDAALAAAHAAVPAPAPVIRQAPAVAPPRLQVALWVNGAAQGSGSERLALPAGTRFQVKVSTNRAGTLAVYAVNPEGQSSAEPLWQTALQAGQSRLTPMLRLAGTRGLETLRLVLLDGDGLPLVERQLHIWHL